MQCLSLANKHQSEKTRQWLCMSRDFDRVRLLSSPAGAWFHQWYMVEQLGFVFSLNCVLLCENCTYVPRHCGVMSMEASMNNTNPRNKWRFLSTDECNMTQITQSVFHVNVERLTDNYGINHETLLLLYPMWCAMNVRFWTLLFRIALWSWGNKHMAFVAQLPAQWKGFMP